MSQLPPGASGNFNFGQTGGENHQTYINQVPTPALIVTGESDWMLVDSAYQKRYSIKLQSPAEIHNIEIIAHGEYVTSVGFILNPDVMIRGTGTAHSGPNWASHETSTPLAVLGFGVIATKPGTVTVETKLR